jgi:hypothetical protein
MFGWWDNGGGSWNGGWMEMTEILTGDGVMPGTVC